MGWLDRQAQLMDDQAMGRLQRARVAVIGLGGVGGAALEGLARAGIGNFLVMDGDVFQQSNLNRQILSTTASLGREKACVAAERIALINPDADVTAVAERFCAQNTAQLLHFAPHWVVDAIDSVGAKVDLIEFCKGRGISLISCMGTGNRLEAQFLVGDITETAGSGCPLARVVRRELRRRSIVDVPVLFCRDAPLETGQRVPGSISFIPPAAGYALAGHVVRQIVGAAPQNR